MTSGEAIKRCMYEKRVSQSELAEMANMSHQSKISESLKRDMRVSTLVRLADALGYKVVIKERDPKDIFAARVTFELTDGLEEVTENS